MKTTILIVVIGWVAAVAGHAHADIGPKPTMHFEFDFSQVGEGVQITEGALEGCETQECSDPRALERVGPQSFDCSATGCGALAYGFAPYNRLAITFSDGEMRQSNTFSKSSRNAKYLVVVREDSLEVRELKAARRSLFAFGAIVIIALGIGGVFLVRRRKK